LQHHIYHKQCHGNEYPCTTTSTRPVLSWSEDSFIEQTIFFWFQSTIVDSFWFFNFTIRPTSDLVWRSQTDLHTFKLIYVDQKFNLLYYLETLSSDEVEESLSSTGSSGLSSFFAASSANFFFSCCSASLDKVSILK